MAIGPPDFVGVGTNKSGTTWWHRLVSMHPDVHVDPRRPKELHHFDSFWSRPFTDDDVVRYHERFERPTGTFAGEWTPRYASDVWVPPLLHRAAPDAKWLLLLRDPWQRFVSELTTSLDRVGSGPSARLPDMALARSRYSEQVRRLRSAHPEEQILVLQYEQCVADPSAMLVRTQRFLGLDVWTPPLDELQRPVNATTAPRPELPEVLRRGFIDAVGDDLEELFASGAVDLRRELWPSIR